MLAFRRAAQTGCPIHLYSTRRSGRLQFVCEVDVDDTTTEIETHEDPEYAVLRVVDRGVRVKMRERMLAGQQEDSDAV